MNHLSRSSISSLTWSRRNALSDLSDALFELTTSPEDIDGDDEWQDW